jgi:NAD(P)-dependent dehydrogenase (short-subunit alcohol dehydrogenase family)
MLCKGRVAIVTGAGRGIGRAHALALAAEGAKVVVNDLGVASDGDEASSQPAQEVVNLIQTRGGEAIVNGDDISDWSRAESIVQAAIDTFGRLDVIVNNAGIVRDRMFVSATEDEWDAVIRVHLKGHFCLSRHACAYWRKQSKAGETVDARIINTSSGAGLFGSVGQSNYSAAKAGIVGLTLVQAAELARYGITSNAIAPAARTRMTETAFAEMMKKPEEGFDGMAPENISPLVVWLASSDSASVTGRMFEISKGSICVMNGWQRGPEQDRGARWDPNELGLVIRDLLAKAQDSMPVYGA